MSYTLNYTGSEIDDILDRAAPGGAIDQALATKQDALTFDDTPESGSDNPVKSGGIYDAIQAGGAAALGAYPTDSVSGDVVSFSDGASNIPVKAFTGSILPQQNLNGQSAPYPAGGGKNKVEGTVRAATTSNGITSQVYANNRLTMSGMATGNGDAYFIFTSPLTLMSGSSYTVGWSGTDNRSRGMNVFLYTGSSFPMYVTAGTDAHSVTFTPSSDITITGIMFRTTVGGTVTAFDCNIQLEVGSTATAYAPYSNICPISGWTGANITRAGKNLYDIAKAGNIVIPNGATRSGEIIRITAGDWTVSRVSSGTVLYYAWNDGTAHESSMTSVLESHFTAAADCDLYLWVGSGASISSVTNLQVEKGSTATAYEAYQGETITIDWTDEAGTVYGGTLDVTTGVLTVDKAMVTLQDFRTWGGLYTAGDVKRLVSASYLNGATAIMCDTLQAFQTLSNISNKTLNSIAITTDGRFVITPSFIQSASTADEAKAILMAADPIQLVYELATPITYQLTPTQVTTLLGSNTVWLDCGSVTELEYRADTKLYIAKLLGNGTRTLAAAPLNRTSILMEPEATPEETGEEE